MKDMIPGGKGDKAKPSDFDPEQLKMGIEVEMEHTKDRRLAREIAMDHLSEDPRYYSKLKKIHKEHSMRSDMHSFEQLLEMMSSVNAWLTEGATPPPPPAAAFRTVPKKDPAPVLKGRTGATPPPIPTRAQKPEPSDDTKSALGGIGVNKYKPKRPDLMHKFDTTTTESLLHALMQIRDVLAEGGGSRARKADRQQAHMDRQGIKHYAPGGRPGLDMDKQKSRKQASPIGLDPLRDKEFRTTRPGYKPQKTKSEPPHRMGEGLASNRMPTNSVKMRKPRPMILRPKPLVRPGSKLKPGTSAGPGF